MTIHVDFEGAVFGTREFLSEDAAYLFANNVATATGRPTVMRCSQETCVIYPHLEELCTTHTVH